MEKKICKDCLIEHPITEFRKVSDRKSGVHSACRKCFNKRSTVYAKTYANKNGKKLYHRNRNLIKLYGITLKEFDEILDRQNGLCAVCNGTAEKSKYNRFHVDHDHATGKVRGLLCHYCNITLGMVNDNPDTLQKLINYLKIHK